jgi:cysteine-rich repeat protein
MSADARPRFGPWIALERAGEGAFGITWRCVHEQDPSRIAAVKAMRAEVESQAAYRARFTAERDLLRTLGTRPHPHLAGWEGSDPSPEPLWIATEFIQGRDLETCLDDGRHPYPFPLGPSQHDRYALALLVGRAVASATGFSHALGMVHRDIKPGNILLGHDGRVVLVDFGIGRDARVERLTAGLTPSPHTAAFAAPEVLEGTRIDDAWLGRVDVYSLGVVLHEILTGEVAHLPYVVDGRGETSPRPRAEALEVPARFAADLRRLVREMTAVDPARRPDMAAVHAQLRELSDHYLPEFDVPTDEQPAAWTPDRKTAPTTAPPEPQDRAPRRGVWKPQAAVELAEFFQPDRPLPTIPTEFAPPPPPPPAPPPPPFPWSRIVAAVLATALLTGAFLFTRPTTCGDGRAAGEEACDDGNRADGDGCDFLCRVENAPTRCGDGVLNAQEACDDGNAVDGDGCSSTCRVESVHACGDGQLDPGERCDDGNLVAGDGCGPGCDVEASFPPASDAQLVAWSKAATRADLTALFDHAAAHPTWLQGFSPTALRALVAASLATAPDLVSRGGTTEAIAPLLADLPGSLTCAEARSWLAWTPDTAATDPRVGSFYKRWCTICQGRLPDLALDAAACARRAKDGYRHADGRCVHQDNLPYLGGCTP